MTVGAIFRGTSGVVATIDGTHAMNAAVAAASSAGATFRGTLAATGAAVAAASSIGPLA